MTLKEKVFCKKAMCFLFLMFVGIVLLCPPRACAQVYDVVDTTKEADVFFYEGDLITLKVYSLTQIAVTKPGIVEISNADVNEILLIGKKVGETTFFIWDEFGKRTVMIHVLDQNLDVIRHRIETLLETAGINTLTLEKNNYEGKLIAKGIVPLDKEDDYNLLIGKYSKHILDMTKKSGELIQVDVQITELTETLTKAMGIAWTPTSFAYDETMPTFDGSVGDFFKIGEFARTNAITATVSALLSEGKGRILSKPRVIVTDGQSSSFNVGGEIPVATTTTSDGGNVQENVSYKSFGVTLSVTPEINGDKIDIDVNVTISDVDSANAVGDNTAFTSTTATTKITLDDGQTIVLAGLIKHNTAEAVTRVPYLSAIPVIGALFRHKSTPLSEKEVVVSITPRILRKKVVSGGEEEDSEEEDGFEKEEGVEDFEPGFLSDVEDRIKEIETELKKEEGIEKVEKEESSKQNVVAEGKEEQENILEDSNISQLITSYVQNLQKKISKTISFPYEAKEKGWEGIVKLTLNVLSDGSLGDVMIKESSGHKVFDKDALNTARICAPFDSFPAELDLEEITVTIPIVYDQSIIFGSEDT